MTGSDWLPDLRAVAWRADGAVGLGRGCRHCWCSAVYGNMCCTVLVMASKVQDGWERCCFAAAVLWLAGPTPAHSQVHLRESLLSTTTHERQGRGAAA